LDWILQCAPVFAGVLHGIEGAIADKGHQLSMKQAAGWEQLAKSIGSNMPTGLIVLGFEAGIGKRSDLSTAFQQLPTVWTMGSPLDFRGDHIQPDHMKIGSLAAEYLIKQGWRDCAVIGAKPGSPAHLMGFRIDSFRWTLQQAGGEAHMALSPDLIRIAPGLHEVNAEVMARLMQEILQRSPRPQALFLEADILAPLVYQQLRAAGLEPQKDIQIVTCNNERPYLAQLEPKPTIIDIQPQIIGRRAVDQLLWRISNRHAPAMRLMVEPVLVKNQLVEPQAEG
jgi:LacI family transcriptional regulator